LKDYKSLSEIQADLFNAQLKLPDLVDFYLQNIEASNEEFNILLEVYSAEARQKALEVQEKVKNNTAGKMAGLVLVNKDNIAQEGKALGAGSQILNGFESLYTATALQRLIDKDAIVIGRANCDEFAMGSSNENSSFGPSKNPLASDRVPGGSSGGSAAAVAANYCHAALGSDTGGSIRQPASFCNQFGFKPTYGRVSRYGLVAYASSLDQIGPITKSIEDAALITEIMSGKDEMDATSSTHEETIEIHPWEKESTSIALLSEAIENEAIHPDIKDYFIKLSQGFSKIGIEHSIEQFPYLDYVVPVYQIISNAEASSNLARFDGIRYGRRSKDASSIDETIIKSRSEGFGEEVKRRIMLGTYVLSEGYYDAYYTKAQQTRRLIKEHAEQLLQKHDFIILPTTPGPAFKLGAKNDDPIALYLEDLFTLQASLSGLPAISLPLGKTRDGLPFGVQLIGSAFKEADLLSFSKYLMERVS